MIIWPLLIGSVCFASIGAIYLKRISNVPATAFDIVVFVVGAFVGALTPATIDGMLHGYNGTPSTSALATLLALSSIPLGGLCGGILATKMASVIRSLTTARNHKP